VNALATSTETMPAVIASGTVLASAADVADWQNDAATMRAILDITQTRSNAEALARVSSIQQQLAVAHSSIEAAARALKCPPFSLAQAVEQAVAHLSQAYPRCSSCHAWIVSGGVFSVSDPGHCGDDGSTPETVVVCGDCNQDAEGIGMGGSPFERARR
jgi:hypothetical protein